MGQENQVVTSSNFLTPARETGFLLFIHSSVVLSPSNIHLCSVCAGACFLLHPLPPYPLPHSKSPEPLLFRRIRDPPPPSPPGWVQGPDFHFNSRLSAEAFPPPRRANKEPTVHRRDVQPALTSLLSSMQLFSPFTEAWGARLVGDRLLALGNTPLILSSPSLFPRRTLWSITDLFDLQLVFMWCRCNK